MPRDGTKNLKPLNQRTKEEQKKIATSGGIASGEARRKKKTMKELFDIALECSPADKRSIKKLAKFYGVEEDEVTAHMAVVHKAIERAEKGNTRAMEFVRDSSGNKLADQVEVSTPISEKIDEINAYMSGK